MKVLIIGVNGFLGRAVAACTTAKGAVVFGLSRSEAPSRAIDAVYLVALADLGDAWFDDETRELNKAIGGGIAGRGRSRYMGLFVAYGIDSEQWELYIRTQPWF